MRGGLCCSLMAACVVLQAACTPAPPSWTDADRARITSGPATNPFVHAQGTQLVDGAGAPIVLRGYNLGGWLTFEGWMFGGGWSLDGERILLARLAELIGEADAARFLEDVRARFITEEDIAAIAATGANVVRVPINHTLLEDAHNGFAPREAGYVVLDRLLDACAQHGVRAILDLHAAPGGQSPYFMADPDDVKLWDDDDNQARTVELWRTLAARYADRDAVAGYDLLNEPAPPDGATLLALYRRIATAIRTVDPHHLIVLEGSAGASDLSPFTAAVTWNQMYSVHQYEFFGDWRSDEVNRWRAVSDAHGVPLWVGEFGLLSAPQLRESVALYEGAMAGYALWSWKEVADAPDAPVIMSSVTPDWLALAAWMNTGRGERPSAERARRALFDFFAAADLVRCTRHHDVINAIARP